MLDLFVFLFLQEVRNKLSKRKREEERKKRLLRVASMMILKTILMTRMRKVMKMMRKVMKMTRKWTLGMTI